MLIIGNQQAGSSRRGAGIVDAATPVALDSGTFFVVQSSATASYTSATAGSEPVSSGRALAGATITGSGAIEIKSGGSTTSGTPINISSGSLVLDNSQNFSGTVAGLTDVNEWIDLKDINFLTLQPVTYSAGTLTVTDGTHTAHIALIGSYVAGDFKSASDGGTGTNIYDPPISSHAVAATS